MGRNNYIPIMQLFAVWWAVFVVCGWSGHRVLCGSVVCQLEECILAGEASNQFKLKDCRMLCRYFVVTNSNCKNVFL